MTDPTATIALCKWLRDRIKEWETEAKAALQMTAGERKAAAVNGKHLGFVTLARGKRHTAVDDADLLDWVKANYPTEVEEAVRPAFRTKLINQAEQLGGIVAPDGQVCSDIIRIGHGDPYPTTQLDPDAGIAISALLSQGRIGVNGIKQLEPSRWQEDTEAGAIGG